MIFYLHFGHLLLKIVNSIIYNLFICVRLSESLIVFFIYPSGWLLTNLLLLLLLTNKKYKHFIKKKLSLHQSNSLLPQSKQLIKK